MKLHLSQIKEIITGAVRVEEENGAVIPYRFTKEQEAWYESTNPDFYKKSLSTAGIKLCFQTDSQSLFLKITAEEGSSRWYFSADVFADGLSVGNLDNFADVDLPQNYAREELPYGTFSKTIPLGEGVKTVCVHLPWSVKTRIDEIAVDDGAFVEGVKPQKKMLVYGDSITQGYDALRPAERYIAKLCEKLGAEEMNKAIGGEVFSPSFAKLNDNFVPDYIMVAYGTNDWYLKEKGEFMADCKGFFENLRQNYPDTKIFAITPIWRKDMHEEKPFGPFESVDGYVREAVGDIGNVTVISGFGFVPQEERYFGDLNLHPNDAGFAHYFENLYKAISKEI